MDSKSIQPTKSINSLKRRYHLRVIKMILLRLLIRLRFSHYKHGNGNINNVRVKFLVLGIILKVFA